jgi:ribosomal protein S18 acetylase RimI-like enzyme
MTLLRPFVEEDNSDLLEIEKLCPHGNDKIAEGADKSPNAVARYNMYDNWKIYVAVENDRTAGWIGWTLKEDVNGTKYGYLIEIAVHPQFQNHGIATELITKAEDDLREDGASYVYGYVFEDNDASNALFKKMGYESINEMQLHAIFTYKEYNVSDDFSIRLAGKEDIPDIVRLLNEYHEGWTNFVPYTPESFEAHIKKVPGYGMDKLWIAFSGEKIVACAGLWDVSTIYRMCYTKEPASMKIYGAVLKFLNHFTNVPTIPAENEFFTNQTMVDYAFVPEAPDAMENLINYMNNATLDLESISIAAMFFSDDPLFPVLQRFKPFVEKWGFYQKSLDGEDRKFELIYPDFRDFVL